MGANNWTVCPQCAARSGSMNHIASALIEQPNRNLETFPEYYEIGVFESENEDEPGFYFMVSYSATCTECRFDFEFDYRIPLKIAKPGDFEQLNGGEKGGAVSRE